MSHSQKMRGRKVCILRTIREWDSPKDDLGRRLVVHILFIFVNKKSSGLLRRPTSPTRSQRRGILIQVKCDSDNDLYGRNYQTLFPCTESYVQLSWYLCDCFCFTCSYVKIDFTFNGVKAEKECHVIRLFN